jgi:Carboxypeptidase regulatory-like domain
LGGFGWSRWILLYGLACAITFAADRSVVGTVYYPGKEPAAEASVQLEDMTTLSVVSRTTDKAGRYRFTGLNPDHDYQIRAIKKGFSTKSRVINRFSSKPVEKADLYLRPEP